MKIDKEALRKRAMAMDPYIKEYILYYPAAFFKNFDPRLGHANMWRIIRAKMADRRPCTHKDLWWIEVMEDVIGTHKKHMGNA